jgi:diguanylate cyclase (GGDEF)-like protein
LFLDLDHFKNLNDSLGHTIGDLLLQQVAERLKRCVREDDTVARLGGDEFVILLAQLSLNYHEAATQVELIAKKILRTLAMPYQLNGHHYVITPSVGIYVFLKNQDAIEDILKKADVAMYQAKASGRNSFCFYDPAMQAAATARKQLESEMRNALLKNEFLLHYQLQVKNLEEFMGVEALVRWQHPKHGMIPPGMFIPLAEETGLILSLGQWVLEAACAQLALWASDSVMCNAVMSVNVSHRGVAKNRR